MANFEVNLSKKPQNPIIIEGVPGLGLIATIVTEFLIKHLNAKSIGYVWSDKLVPIAAIHESKILKPLEIFYDQKTNIMIVHALSDIRGLEWDIADLLLELAKQTKAKEIITIEGVMGQNTDAKAYMLSANAEKVKEFGKLKIDVLGEGIIVGPTAALLLKNKDTNISGIFVETHSKLPDSRAAAKIIETLDIYLKLKLDPKPLLEMAEQFETKLKQVFEKSREVLEEKKKKEVTYVG
ncbi:proteasome assembly chaperone family protein [archaeon]|nr:proteasome assembly chaperone family protein [archaeon]